MAQAVSCPDRSQLQQFLLGKVSDAEADQLETHLARIFHSLAKVSNSAMAQGLVEMGVTTLPTRPYQEPSR
jgi:hypothetical protein